MSIKVENGCPGEVSSSWDIYLELTSGILVEATVNVNQCNDTESLKSRKFSDPYEATPIGRIVKYSKKFRDMFAPLSVVKLS